MKFELVAETVWSCPVHSNDTSYGGDQWEIPGEVCLDCETGSWRKKRDADGNVVMRERTQFEIMLMKFREATERVKVAWLEEVLLPGMSSEA